MRRIVMVTMVVALTGGCLTQQIEQRLYLDPQGGLSWTVLQQEVRSDARGPSGRAAEEQSFLDRARAAEHGVARAFDALGARRVETLVLRERRPYAVFTSAEMGPVDRVLETFLRRLGVEARAGLLRQGASRHLELVFRPGDGEADVDEDEPALALADDLEAFRFVLTSGRFTAAEGFRLDDDHRAAVMLDPEEGDPERLGDEVVYRLSWISAADEGEFDGPGEPGVR